MFSLNRIQIIGYQTQPVTIRQTPGGTSVSDLNLVVPTSFTSGSGEQLHGRSFHTVTVWGALADVCGQFVRPGAQLFIAGRLQTDSWDDATSGEKRSKTKIIASELIMLDPKGGQLPEVEGAKAIVGACNRADIIGNVTKDPEMRTTTSGQKVLSLGVATNDKWKDKATGEMKEKSEFHNVVVWGELAEAVATAVHKGNRVFVSGRVQTRSWETQAGAKRTTTEIIAESFSLLGMRSAVAEESIQMDGSPRRESAPASSMNQDVSDAFGTDPSATLGTSPSTALGAGPSPALAAVSNNQSMPDLQYGSDIKVEDLPF